MSLIQESNAIFYHPLDSDKTEFLASQVWSGDNAFTEGVIAEGISAISSAGMSIGSPFTFLTSAGTEDENAVLIDRLTDDTALLSYAGEPGNKSNVRIATVSGSDISFGSVFPFSDTDLAQRLYGVSVLTPTKFIVFYDEGATGKARVGTISGTDVTFYPPVQFDDLGGDRIRAITVRSGVSGVGAIAYSPKLGGSGFVQLAEITGVSGTSLTFGPKAIIESGTRTVDNSIAATPNGSGLIVAYQRDDTKDLAVKPFSISGLVATPGSGLIIDDSSDVVGGHVTNIISLQEDIVALGWKDGSNTDAPRQIKCTALAISGTTMVSGATILVEDARPTVTTEEITLSRTNDTTFQFFYNRAGFAGNPTSPGRVHAVTLTSVDDLTLDFGVSSSLPGVRLTGAWSDSLTAEKYLYGYRDFDDDDDLKILIGTLDLDNSLTSTDGNAYSGAVSGTHITMGMWTQEPTLDTSFITIERGYKVTLSDASGITLGGSTLSWATSGVSGLLGTLNDGNSHFLVLDFNYSGSANWELNTSIDGLPFSSQGTQSGLTPISTDTIPNITLSNPSGVNQWVDELVMWIDNIQFTDFELTKLNALAPQLTMNQYSTFGFPTSGTINLHVSGALEAPASSNVDIHTAGRDTIGILDPLDVVFYHALDDKTEYTQGQAWTGDPEFVGGKIGSGNSAIAPTSVSFEIDGDIDDPNPDGTSYQTGRLINLTDTKVVDVHGSFEGGWNRRGIAGTVDIDAASVTWGTSVIKRAGNVGSTDGVALTSGTFLHLTGNSANAGESRVGTVSGTDISYGTTDTWNSDGPGPFNIQALSASSVIVAYADSISSLFHGKVKIGEVAGTNTTYTSSTTFSSSGIVNEISIAIMSASGFVICYRDDSDDAMRAIVGSISGTTVSFDGSPILIDSDIGTDGSAAIQAVAIDETRFLVCYVATSNKMRSKIGTVSGISISFDSAQIPPGATSVGYLQGGITLHKHSSDTFVVNHRSFSPARSMRTNVGKLAGSTLTWGPSNLYGGTSNAAFTTVKWRSDVFLSSLKKFAGGNSSQFGIATINETSDLTASTPIRYPTAIGEDRIITAFWAKNPTTSGSEVVLQRGYTTTFGSGSISLGGNTISWSGSSVQSVMTTLNDGLEHFLVTDFEYQGNFIWQLQTSVDGASFISHGTVSGQPITTTTSDPQIIISNLQNANQYLDEVVMWAGNSNSFNDTELGKLNALGDTFGLTMPNFAQSFLTTSGNITLQETGHIQVSGSIDLTVSGSLMPSGGVDLHSAGKDTTGILDELDVIFYHALDDKTEYTQGQSWVGSGNFVGGKIGDGVSALSPLDLTCIVGNQSVPTQTMIAWHQVMRLTDIKIVSLYSDFLSGQFNQRVLVGNIVSSGINWGPAADGRTANVRGRGVGLDSDTFIMADGTDALVGLVRVGKVSGTDDITFGSDKTFASTGSARFNLKKLNASGFVICYHDAAGAVFDGKTRIGEVSGSTITLGSSTIFESGAIDESNIAILDATTAVVCYRDQATSGVEAKIGTISGTTITWPASGFTVDASIGTDARVLVDVEAISDTEFLVVYEAHSGVIGSETVAEGRSQIGTIVGDNITFGPTTIWTDAGATLALSNPSILSNPTSRGLARISPTAYVMSYRRIFNLSGRAHASKFGVVRNGIISWGSAQCTPLSIRGPNVVSVETSPSGFVLQLIKRTPSFTSIDEVGTVIQDASDLSAPTPIRYPTAIGEDKIITAFWAKLPTVSGSQVVIQRGYTTTFMSGSISLGTETATWTGPSIETVMSTLNDGGEHFLVSDFSHVSGTTWALQTSVDGAPFINHGSESGQSIISTTSNPNIIISNVESTDQYLDEAVMWAGNANSFNSTELAKLHALAENFNLTMPNFNQAFLQSSGNMELQITGHEEVSGAVTVHSAGRDTIGILDELDVIFYHALDDKTEYTQGQSWVGSGNFVGGKIGDGVSALSPLDLTCFYPGTDSSSGISYLGRDLITLEDNKIVSFYTLSSQFQKARVGLVASTGIAWGTEEAARTLFNGNIRAVALDSETFVMIDAVTTTTGKTRVGKVSGTDIALGSDADFVSAGSLRHSVAKLSANEVLITYHDSTGVGDSRFQGITKIGQVSGNTITVGPENKFQTTSINESNCVALTTSTVVVCYYDVVSVDLRAKIGTVSGTTISWGSAFIVESGAAATTAALLVNTERVSDTEFVVLYEKDNGALGSFRKGLGKSRIGTLSGGSISFGATTEWAPSASEAIVTNVPNKGLMQISDTSYIMSYRKRIVSQATWHAAKLGNVVSGAIQWGSIQCGSIGGIDEVHATKTSASGFVLELRNQSAVEPRNYLGTIIQDASNLSAPTPIRYPTAIGKDKIITAFWAKLPTISGSEIVLQRGYTATFTSGSISLGESTATWSDSSIASVMSTLNDGGEHFLVTDFSHISGTTWALQTSVDGKPFVSHGSESGQSIISTTSNPNIIISNVESTDQYLDEVVMWAGNADSFNDTELAKLNALADVFDLTMPNFASTFVSTSDNATLFIAGYEEISDDITLHLCCPLDNISGTITLSISGSIPEPSGFDRIIDLFTKTPDFDPQIIGRFDTSPVSMTIQVWDLIGGVNTELILGSSGVEQIGDTITWRWSTEFLLVDNHFGHFAFRMTADTSETVDGEFMLDNPEGHLWGHPEDPDEFRLIT